eukprot:CAMPEP_0177496612 /NCGR_PEP_ID=MMETSP0369-20130122/34597_1 /TAXON_ID=447022 ORGANISM="Scrippsiella hangoei-like, Strain SHHI-4" /NCGR_SAMPLE_ID=MMETSP0369 /ASSEMBLY_ACC=CAM_ASM_000364 /LENGTH=202 /DNA_ID=CAMNT_0018973689 /DNA_START=211 /DNA_END=816 /DNA_ORIENTATION=+
MTANVHLVAQVQHVAAQQQVLLIQQAHFLFEHEQRLDQAPVAFQIHDLGLPNVAILVEVHAELHAIQHEQGLGHAQFLLQPLAFAAPLASGCAALALDGVGGNGGRAAKELDAAAPAPPAAPELDAAAKPPPVLEAAPEEAEAPSWPPAAPDRVGSTVETMGATTGEEDTSCASPARSVSGLDTGAASCSRSASAFTSAFTS